MKKTVNNLYFRVASAARKWRLFNKIKLVDIAKEIGCTPAAVHNFENGHSNNATILIAYMNLGFDYREYIYEKC